MDWMPGVYKNHCHVERRMRNLKSDLPIRPIYLHRDDAIVALCFVCVVALMVYTPIERDCQSNPALAEAGLTTTDQVLEALTSFCLTVFCTPSGYEVFWLTPQWRPNKGNNKMLNRAWLVQCASIAPYQPATALWRAIELEFVSRWTLPQGLGLDVGCGDGSTMALIKQQRPDWTLVGIDLDPEETRLAQKSGVYTTVFTANAQSIPAPDSTFDFAFSNSVLEHIPQIDPVLQEVARILKRNAPFMFTVPSHEFHTCLAGPGMVDRLRGWNRETYLKDLDRRLAHHRYWCPETWQQHLAQAGLQLVRHGGYLTQPEVRRWEFIANFTAGVLYAFYGRKRRPIEIQRTLKIRRQQFPAIVRKMFALILSILAAGLPNRDHPTPTGPFGGLLIEARRY
jgi:ubiquinone/menaquinone biosynthesis C-methylase UbiE